MILIAESASGFAIPSSSNISRCMRQIFAQFFWISSFAGVDDCCKIINIGKGRAGWATVRLRPLDGILGWRYAPVFVQEQARRRTQHNTTCYIHSLVPKSAILSVAESKIGAGSVARAVD